MDQALFRCGNLSSHVDSLARERHSYLSQRIQRYHVCNRSFAKEVRIIWPSAAKLFISASTEDADIFLILRVFTPDLKEVTFSRSNNPHTPMAHGWLRASHRKLDSARARNHTAPIILTMKSSRLSQGKFVSWILRYGRPALSCRKATASRSPFAGRITNILPI